MIHPDFTSMYVGMILLVPSTAPILSHHSDKEYPRSGSSAETEYFVPARVFSINNKNYTFSVRSMEPLLFPSKKDGVFRVREVFVT
eukprot:m.81491 g.81491  ORF g.81491 m.81491 type:complete len:86 (+) comp8644_c0_seq23:128-385(+)